MKRVDIIVPVKNEAKNIYALVKRIDVAMQAGGAPYRIIFIDDHSTDLTVFEIKRLQIDYPIIWFYKKGKSGKAYSIIEAAAISNAENLVMIDADLQYPPEVIPEMLRFLEKHGVVVARRADYEASKVRRFISDSYNLIFNKLLHGFDLDIQSGLKAFKREIILKLDQEKITPWTIDLSLLLTAKNLGYTIGQVDITFSKRQEGRSNVNLLKTSLEIGFNSLKLRFQGKKIYSIQPLTRRSMEGAGVVYKGERLISHTTLESDYSAIETFWPWQKVFFAVVIVLFLGGLVVNPWLTLIAVLGLLTTIFFADSFFNLYVILKSLHFPPELRFSRKELEEIEDQELPLFTILCPLYKESNILPHFINYINRLSYPKKRLEVLLLLEENDQETIQTAKKINLPKFIKTLIVPQSQPKTKPKACNFGLNYASGEYLVIYDAEDRPDKYQLEKAYLAYKQLPDEVVCLQAKLNYFNPNHNLLTRFFTAEYSLWFDVILSGFQSINSVIPLGGTSNIFKTKILKKLKGWDPFNVTEDCDLGVRLFKAGYKTALIDSTTLEEANANVKNWIRQRSRWIKGYMQTYLVHMRNPISFVQEHGIHALVFQLIIGLRISFMLINPILWGMTIAYFSFRSQIGVDIERLYPNPFFYLAVVSLLFGNFLYIYNYMIGCSKRGHFGLVKYVYLIPVYWLLASIAAYMAIWQLITKPHYWEKTVHGLFFGRSRVGTQPSFLFRPLHLSIKLLGR